MSDDESEPAGEGSGGGEGGEGGEDGGGGETDPVLDALFATIERRRSELPEGSYTASLFTHEKGENATLEKVGEEATEAILAAKDDDREALVAESADLVYHLLVLLAMNDLTVDDLRDELADRF